MKVLRLAVIFSALLAAVPVFAQGNTQEDKEKALYESIQKRLDIMSSEYDLEDWQLFYLDSIMVHDYTCMQQELDELKKSRVESSKPYIAVQDKWGEQIYNGFRKVLNDDQWKKYLKSGADREKKSRDKRASEKKK